VRADGQPSTALRRRIEVAAAYGATLPDPLYVPTGGAARCWAARPHARRHRTG
jgi:hypothetical protein